MEPATFFAPTATDQGDNAGASVPSSSQAAA